MLPKSISFANNGLNFYNSPTLISTSKQVETTEVLIIGAGAAGLMCAATAGYRGKQVTVVDMGKKPGRKILISGGGRCNFTNENATPDNYLCQNPHFVKSALGRYSAQDFIVHQSTFEKNCSNWPEYESIQLTVKFSTTDLEIQAFQLATNPPS